MTTTMNRGGGLDASLDLRLPLAAEAPSRVRRSLGGLVDFLDKETLGDVRLLISELVSNSVRHTGRHGWVEVEVRVFDRRLRVDVLDSGDGFRPGRPDDDEQGGWGLRLVEEMTDRWGVSSSTRGGVWFEIDLV